MRLTSRLVLIAFLVANLLGGNAVLTAAAPGEPFPYCKLLRMPPPEQPGHSAPKPPAPAGDTTPAANPIPTIADLLKETSDAAEIVNRILSAAAPHKPEELERIYDSVFSLIVSRYIEPVRLMTVDLPKYRKMYKGKITNWKELSAALKDLTGAVDDRWTYFRDPAEALAMQIAGAENQVVDFGAHVRSNPDGTFVVEHITPGSTAQLVGIREGDSIISVNGQMLKGMSKADIAKLARGPEGSLLRVVSIQDGQKVEAEYNLHPPAPDAQDPKADVIDNNIAYIKLPSFVSVEQFNQLLNALMTFDVTVPGGLTAIVLDLRYNGGGLVEMAKHLIATLHSRTVVLHERSRRGLLLEDLTTTVLPMPGIMAIEYSQAQLAVLASLKRLPLGIIINGSSASSAEMVTRALRDVRPNTTVIGTQSFGKGVEMVVIPLANCGELGITSAMYTTASGQWLHGAGITPDKVVFQVRGSKDDAQMAATLELLRNQTVASGSNVAGRFQDDTAILGPVAPRPLEPVVASWEQFFTVHRAAIMRGGVGLVLVIILLSYWWLTRRRRGSGQGQAH